MKRKYSSPIKIGDQVQILSGFYKGDSAKVLSINKKTGKITLKGLNLKFKHYKSSGENSVGEIRQIEAPIHHSNVKLIVTKTS
jgi:large subunit ribosomal protein L24